MKKKGGEAGEQVQSRSTLLWRQTSGRSAGEGGNKNDGRKKKERKESENERK